MTQAWAQGSSLVVVGVGKENFADKNYKTDILNKK